MFQASKQPNGDDCGVYMLEFLQNVISACCNFEALINLDTSLISRLSTHTIQLRRQDLMKRYSQPAPPIKETPHDIVDLIAQTDTSASEPVSPNSPTDVMSTPIPLSIVPDAPSPLLQRAHQHAEQTEAQKVRQEHQAKRMRGRATMELLNAAVGDVVMIAIPKIDRSNLDPPNLACVVVQKTAHGSFRLATTAGVLNDTLFPADILAVSKQNAEYHELGDVMLRWTCKHQIPLPNISLRQAAAASSVVGGQGIQKCSCTGSCNTTKCGCFRIGRGCGSRCHYANSCKNK
jgi:hypothetical protein